MKNKKNAPSVDLSALPQAVRDHIDQLERVRQDFVANVSHELRTPLTVIRGYLETLLKQAQPADGASQKIFNQMYQHSLRMETIIDELLLLSRLESEEQPMDASQRIDVPSILETLRSDAENISGEKQHVIELEAMPTLQLLGSEEGLKSLFSNLIINAVKYTPAKGHITIRWFLEKNCAVFQVVDTGIGIAKKHIPRITERFYRVDKARSRESGGTGLGLAIVKHVLARYQAELSIDSKLREGSTFTCIFPNNRVFVIKSS